MSKPDPEFEEAIRIGLKRFRRFRRQVALMLGKDILKRLQTPDQWEYDWRRFWTKHSHKLN